MNILEEILNNKKYAEDLITRSTYNSNAIEGSTLTYTETYAVLYNDNSFKIQGKEPREIYEAINHKKAIELLIKELQEKSELNEKFIKELNKIINKDIKETEKIHPFEDGNGRTGRILLDYELIKNNVAPIVIAKEDRVMYFEFLRNNDYQGMAKWFEELSKNEEERIKIFKN